MTRNSQLPERLAFNGIDAETCALLRANKAFILSTLDGILDAFYEHVAKYPQTAAFFRSREHMMHAKAMQLRHWQIIADGRFDESYEQSITRIGETHNRLGLEPRWYIGSYSFILVRLMAAIGDAMKPSPLPWGRRTDAAALQAALARAIMVDMDLAISIYLEAGRRERATTLENLATAFEASVGQIVATVAGTSRELEGAAAALSGSAEESTRQCSTATNALDLASTNVQSVASAAEEMSNSIREISRQVEQSLTVSRRAVSEAADTNGQVRNLSDNADRIGAIVSLIDDIAGKTNLLALNATIEAARAGEAGKGFAVVAQEVKTLAAQTAKATAEIGDQIASVQASTRAAADAIEGIGRTIEEMNGIAATIAAAVEEQNAATEEIARSVMEASRGTGEVSTNMRSVTQASGESSSAAASVLDYAGSLARQASELREQVDKFVATVRAA